MPPSEPASTGPSPTSCQAGGSTLARTIVLHDGGDAILLIGSEEKQQPILVSKTVMALASPVWKAMFDRQQWAESSATEIPFPDDNIDAMLIVLQIAHLRFRDLPGKKRLTFQALVDLAVVCDKYDIVKLVRPFIDLHRWYEGFVPVVDAKETFHPYWLFVAWTFGYVKSFERLARYLVLTIELDAYGVPTVPTDNLSPGVLESILNVRKATLTAIVQAAHDIVNKILEGSICRIIYPQRDNSHEDKCRAMVFGSYMEWLIKNKLYPFNLADEELLISIQGIREVIVQLKLKYLETYDSRVRVTHESCGDIVDLKSKVDDIISQMPSATLDVHRRHTEEQAKK